MRSADFAILQLGVKFAAFAHELHIFADGDARQPGFGCDIGCGEAAFPFGNRSLDKAKSLVADAFAFVVAGREEDVLRNALIDLFLRHVLILQHAFSFGDGAHRGFAQTLAGGGLEDII